MDKPGQLTAMISGTARDLPEHRQQVVDASLRAGIFPIGMEHLPARDANGLRVSLEMVESAPGVRRESAQPNNLPYPSLGTLFKGREDFLGQIRSALGTAGEAGATRAAAITAPAATVHGLGGVGKTRAAVEYAHRHAGEFTALLFVRADSPEALKTNLAGLCDPLVLDLEEKSATELDVQLAAVLRWLGQNRGWFLILDNVDSEPAAREVESLLGHLAGKGQVLITSRLSQWSGGVTRLDLDVHTEEDAAGFLLERTVRGRRPLDDDPARARELAVVLGQLALALEQAGAYIDAQRLTFAQYLTEWRGQQKRVLTWSDERVLQYPKSVAVTCRTSFDQLTPRARQLIHYLAWFAPDPIPEFLLDLPVAESTDDEPSPAANPVIRRDALAELEKYSLVVRAARSPIFTVHRLVQAVTRQSLVEDTSHKALIQALNWLNAAFVGDPSDVRSWPVLDPLASHAGACSQYADQAGISDPAARLLSALGTLYSAKAQHAKAEPLMRRALAIDEKSYGPDHPDVAGDLNNLAALLQDSNPLAEAEPLMRRMLEILLKFTRATGHPHPHLQAAARNYVGLLTAMGCTQEEALVKLRDLAPAFFAK